MSEQQPPLDMGVVPTAVKVLWFFGVPTIFAIWLLYYVLYVVPVQSAQLIKLEVQIAKSNETVNHHERAQAEKINELIRAINYDEAILRAICFAIIPYRNKDEMSKCQPIFAREFELSNSQQ